MGKLILTTNIDPDGSCELLAEVHSNGFSGEGSAWFNTQEISDFANLLKQYPIPLTQKPELLSGYWNPNDPHKILQKHLHIAVYPIDGVGNLGVRVELFSPLHSGSRPESRHSAEVELQTNYNALAGFSTQILQLLHGQRPDAILE